jgi:hypothetical protein
MNKTQMLMTKSNKKLRKRRKKLGPKRENKKLKKKI